MDCHPSFTSILCLVSWPSLLRRDYERCPISHHSRIRCFDFLGRVAFMQRILLLGHALIPLHRDTVSDESASQSYVARLWNAMRKNRYMQQSNMATSVTTYPRWPSEASPIAHMSHNDLCLPRILIFQPNVMTAQRFFFSHTFAAQGPARCTALFCARCLPISVSSS